MSKNAQEIIRELGADDAVDLAADILAQTHTPYKRWLPGDLESFYTEGEDGRFWRDGQDRSYSEASLDLIVDRAQGSGYWQSLSECTNADWENVELALDEAEVGV